MRKPITSTAERGHCLTMTLDHPRARAVPRRVMKSWQWVGIRSADGRHEIQADDRGMVRCYTGNVLADEHRDAALAGRIWARWADLEGDR